MDIVICTEKTYSEAGGAVRGKAIRAPILQMLTGLKEFNLFKFANYEIYLS